MGLIILPFLLIAIIASGILIVVFHKYTFEIIETLGIQQYH